MEILKINLVKIFRQGGQAFLLAVVFFFVIRYISINFTSLEERSWSIEWGFILIAFFCIWGSFLLMALYLRMVFSSFGVRLKYFQAWKIWYLPMLGKYVPGKVWTAIGMVYAASQEKVSPKVAVPVAIISQIIVFPSLAIAFLVTIPFWKIGPSQHQIIFVLLILAGIMLMLCPKLFHFFLNLTLRKIGRRQIHMEVKYLQILRLIFFSTTIWISYGLAFAFFARSLTLVSWSDFPMLVGSFCLSILFGLMSVFAPAGIGVREGTLITVLSQYFPPDVTIVISVGSRVWLIVAEIIFFGISSLLLKNRDSSKICKKISST